ncbi:hypothetical protein BC831DRAFT_464383 [Entophlyctis helioformis]|nr:hypothetical protein BC831DRAFT_464383 [Entophlyctis helioformis]
MDRSASAYQTWAAILCGLGLQTLASAGLLMMSKSKAWSTTFFRLALATWLFQAVFLVAHVSLLDWRISPYKVSEKWYLHRFFILIASGWVSDMMLSITMIMRVRVVLQPGSSSFIIIALFGVASMLSLTAFSVGGILTGVRSVEAVSQNRDLLHDPTISIFIAVYHGFYAVFSILCSMAFLYTISKTLGVRTKDFFARVLFDTEGANFIVIILLCVFSAVGQVLIATLKVSNYMAFVSLYADTFLYPLQLYTFLTTSYISARKIVEDNTLAVGGHGHAYRGAGGPTSPALMRITIPKVGNGLPEDDIEQSSNGPETATTNTPTSMNGPTAGAPTVDSPMYQHVRAEMSPSSPRSPSLPLNATQPNAKATRHIPEFAFHTKKAGSLTSKLNNKSTKVTSVRGVDRVNEDMPLTMIASVTPELHQNGPKTFYSRPSEEVPVHKSSVFQYTGFVPPMPGQPAPQTAGSNVAEAKPRASYARNW